MENIAVPVLENGSYRPRTIDVGSLVHEAINDENQRYERLQRTEWQRWTPALGVYRLIRDNISGDQSRLNTMHSTAYEVVVNFYNILQTGAIIVGGAVGLQQLIQNLF